MLRFVIIVERSTILNQSTVIHASLNGFGEDNLCICLDCGGSDSAHEVEFPSKRTEIKNGKKVVICEKFVAYRTIEEPKKELIVEVK